MGQAVARPGTAMSDTLRGVSRSKLLELPVFEDTQMGMAIGMAIGGWFPITIYPRWNFLLCATNQLVNHLDKLARYSGGGYRPRVIVRVGIGASEPLDPGPQHLGDFTDAFRMLLKSTRVVRLEEPSEIVGEYESAMKREGSTVLVEDVRRY
jgi:pyruvate/2-oxoglutarate/acetoin dehydrogenase E1 component